MSDASSPQPPARQGNVEGGPDDRCEHGESHGGLLCAKCLEDDRKTYEEARRAAALAPKELYD